MSFMSELPYPVLIGTGAVLTSGSTENLTAGQLALVDTTTHNVLATTDLNGVVHPEILIAMGSYHTVDKLSKFIGGLKQSTKTQDFLGKDVIEFHVSRPLPLKQDIVQIGWDGVNDCDSLAFECGKSYRFKVSVSGEDVFRTFSRPLYRFIQFDTECCPDANCTDTCDDTVGPKSYAQKLADLINNDPELKFFVKAEAVCDDYEAPDATHRIYTLRVCDNGGVLDLAAVQNAFPTLGVIRSGRIDSTSIYEICFPITFDEEEEEVPPSDFTPTSSILQAVCGVCPTGYTPVAAQNVYTVVRPLAGTENLVGSTAQQTFADAVGTQYETATAITFNGATAVEVVALSDAITLTAHGFQTGDKVVYADGGGTQIVGLTDTNTYYVIRVDADTIKLATTEANAIAGTAIAISDGVGASHTVTPVITATFLSNNGDSALVQLKTTGGVELVAILADTVLFSHTEPASCTPPANSAIEWVAGDERHRTTRTLCLTMNKECESQNRLADLVAFYASNTDLASAITVSQAGTCADTYTVTQYSKGCMEDGCLSEAIAEYDVLQSFEGFVWETCPCPVDEEEDSTVNCGVRITGAFVDTRFGDCSFEPTDYFSTRPLRITVSHVDESGNPCANPVKVTKLQFGQVATQSGEWLRREYLKANSLEAYNIWNNDPRIREVFDSQILSFIDKNKSYVIYYVVYVQNRHRANWATMQPQDKFETIIAFPEGTDTSSFENLFGGYFSQFGVVLKERGV